MKSKKVLGVREEQSNHWASCLATSYRRDYKMLKSYRMTPESVTGQDYVDYIYRISLNTTSQHTLQLHYCSAT